MYKYNLGLKKITKRLYAIMWRWRWRLRWWQR